MTPVEMIEALQKECLKDPDEFVPGTDVAFLEDVAKRLTPILAAARAQEQELAAMKEPMQEKDVSVSEETFQSLLEKQHSADLREIAEMAINKQNVADHDAVHVGCDAVPCSLMEKLRKVRLIADSILREFREKKAEVGK